MRVIVAAATAVFVGLVAVLAAVLSGRPAPARTHVETTYRAAAPVCSVDDPRLGAISGMAATDDGLWVVEDRDNSLVLLDAACRVDRVVPLASRLLEKHKARLRDVEDLVAGPDGWLWVADTGSNREPRSRVQLVGYDPATDAVRYATLTYPSGTYDTEAALVDSDGRVVLVTKDQFHPATVFSTPGPITEGETALVRRGTLRLGDKGAPARSRVVTGAAVSRSGVVVALRTYTDAWEYDVVDGDVATALLSGTPRKVPLPASKQGEAITYTDGDTAFLLCTEGLPAPVDRVDITRSLVEGR